MTPLALATDPDLVLDALRDSSPCTACGSRDAAWLEIGGCSDCRPRAYFCWICRNAVKDDDLEARRALDTDNNEVWLCGRCWERKQPETPLSYEEWEGDDDD